MAHHVIEKESLLRLNRTLALSLVWGGLIACALSAAVLDVGHWVNAW